MERSSLFAVNGMQRSLTCNVHQPSNTHDQSLQALGKLRLFTGPRLVALALFALVFSACLIQIFLPEMNIDLGNGYRLLTTDGNNPMIQDQLNHRVVVDEAIDRIVWIDDILIGHSTLRNNPDKWFVLDTKARVVEFFATQNGAEEYAREAHQLLTPFDYVTAFRPTQHRSQDR